MSTHSCYPVSPLQLYVEFCVSHELTPEEARRLPPPPVRAARLADEVCLAWALLDLRGLPSLHEGRRLRLPLCGGPLSLRTPLRTCYMAAAAADAAAEQGQTAAAAAAAAKLTPPGRKGLLGGVIEPSLSLRLAPVPLTDVPAASLLPSAAIASPPLATIAGLYRSMLVTALPPVGALPPSSEVDAFSGSRGMGSAAQQPAAAPLGDVVLASIPAILDDPDLSAAFFYLWTKATAKGKPRRGQAAIELQSLLRRCAAQVWAMAGSQASHF